MKKSLLALAVLGALASAASAQSSVTIYGKIDQALAKNVGTENKEVVDNAGSRLGFRGVEDLGGGMKALFGMEHRFTPDTGQANANFWQGYSTVGLSTPYGTVNLGRQYVAAFLVQNAIDPWGADTILNMRDAFIRPRAVAETAGKPTAKLYSAGTGVLGTLRVADSVRYDYAGHGFGFAASVGESLAGGNKPVSYALTYTAGPLFVGVAYEDPSDANDNDKLTTVGGTYAFSFAKLALAYTAAKTTLDQSVKGLLIGATIPYGALEIKLGYGQARQTLLNGSDINFKRAGIGLHYSLSKRTKVYADYARLGGDVDAVSADNKNGYDFGIQHLF